jgi:uncharacterized protein YutE (UPF0331/DUF86 family)
MDYDVERIGSIVSDIRRYFKDLEDIDVKAEKDLKDVKNYYSVSMLLFTIVNRTIDLGEEIVVAEGLGMPSTYRDIFTILADASIIDDTLRDELSGLVSYRNRLAHQYQALNERDIYRIYRRLGSVKAFAEAVVRRVGP